MLMELGRLCNDVKLVNIADSDKKVLNNTIAIKKSKDNTVFVDIVAWNGTAEFISNHYNKGNEILLSGELINKNRKKDDVEYETVAILVEKVYFTYGNHKNEDIPDFLPSN